MKIVLLSSDAIDTRMAGPGIRYWECAKQLSQQHEVLLLTPNRSSLTHPRIQLIQRTAATLKTALQQADVMITQGFGFPIAPVLFSDTPLVVDFSFPLSVELLEHHTHLPLNAAQLSFNYCVERTKLLLRRGDFFLYSHEHQRDYWIGMLTAVGRIDHALYRDDPNVKRLFGCVPFGLSPDSPKKTRPAFRGENALVPIEQIDPEHDTVLLWGGGLWRWFDPCTVIRAMGAISQQRQDIKLVFICGKRAHSDTLNIGYATDEAIALSKELGVYDRTVFFNTEWVPYQERDNYFLESDIGISTHYHNLETRFSFRTRLLDYLWAELPILTTSGDCLSEVVEAEQLGLVVEPSDVEGLQQAILRLGNDHTFFEQCRANIRRVRPHYAWNAILQPLETYCAAPYRTSSLGTVARCYYLARFYANTARALIKYRGYRKLWQKFRQKRGW